MNQADPRWKPAKVGTHGPSSTSILLTEGQGPISVGQKNRGHRRFCVIVFPGPPWWGDDSVRGSGRRVLAVHHSPLPWERRGGWNRRGRTTKVIQVPGAARHGALPAGRERRHLDVGPARMTSGLQVSTTDRPAPRRTLIRPANPCKHEACRHLPVETTRLFVESFASQPTDEKPVNRPAPNSSCFARTGRFP